MTTPQLKLQLSSDEYQQQDYVTTGKLLLRTPAFTTAQSFDMSEQRTHRAKDPENVQEGAEGFLSSAV